MARNTRIGVAVLGRRSLAYARPLHPPVVLDQALDLPAVSGAHELLVVVAAGDQHVVGWPRSRAQQWIIAPTLARSPSRSIWKLDTTWWSTGAWLSDCSSHAQRLLTRGPAGPLRRGVVEVGVVGEDRLQQPPVAVVAPAPGVVGDDPLDVELSTH